MKYDPQLHHWTPWTIAELRTALAGHRGRWWLSGGMALEHRAGRILREHGDLDVSVLRDGLDPLIAALGDGIEAWAAVDGHLDRLTEDAAEVRNVWLSAAGSTRYVLQVNVEDGDRHRWSYGRYPEIGLPWREAVTTVDGVPTGSIATQLLWKARTPRPLDDIDFRAGWPLLGSTQREWLRAAIRRAHPDSPWAAA